MKLQIGQATFSVELYQEDMGGEFPGECEWQLDAKSLRLILERFPKLETSAMIPDAIGDAIEYAETEDGEPAETLADLPDDCVISFRDADSGIFLVRAMAEIGGEWELSWQGENETWFFHDWDHATHDAYERAGEIRIEIDGERELRAQIAGGREALKHGIGLDTVCEALASILEPFRERFGYAPDRLFSGVFEGFEVAKLGAV